MESCSGNVKLTLTGWTNKSQGKICKIKDQNLKETLQVKKCNADK